MPRSNVFTRKTVDDFEALLAEAIHLELHKQRIKGGKKRSEEIENEVRSMFANPENWEQTGMVLITYVDEATGQAETVGLFQEFQHKRTQARKLELCTTDMTVISETPAKEEITHDRCMTAGPICYCPPSPPANQYERQAIKAYLARTKGPSLTDFLKGVELKPRKGETKIDVERLLREI